MIRRPPRSTQSRSSAASDVYKRQVHGELLQAAVQQSEYHTVALPRLEKNPQLKDLKCLDQDSCNRFCTVLFNHKNFLSYNAFYVVALDSIDQVQLRRYIRSIQSGTK
eukprot:TRINITY_DN5553_c0_g2_i1.p1 TRINITY_DN5553_c0_g2~~TRINITY_DN5553_c0_g2_i1.p1  ORF type:complete len:108 (+),score=14.72 TRINITY_DN5553_c0_g2_i1:1-324(+)